ncbi:hypothetical protein TNCV_1324641 [Trichonephila clavipes]|nr:hypothetical protein TNCV_1324641 [Trichonephila clavipes]
MPLKEDPSCLGESGQTVIQRLNSLWKRLSGDEDICPCMRNFYRNMRIWATSGKSRWMDLELHFTCHTMVFITPKSLQLNRELFLMHQVLQRVGNL